jgi:hypothetical protein
MEQLGSRVKSTVKITGPLLITPRINANVCESAQTRKVRRYYREPMPLAGSSGFSLEAAIFFGNQKHKL